MKKYFAFCCTLLAVLLGMAWLSCGVAEEFEPLRVYVHDALTLRYEVVGGSGQYEVVSTSLTDSSGAAVSPSEFKDLSYYYATVTVRDLVTGETATDTSGTQYKDPNNYSCEEGRHTAYGSEDAGDRSEMTERVNVEYLNITETEHTVHYTRAYRCIYCNAYMFSKESSVVETHYFNRDTGYCKCGKYDATLVCAHSNVNDDDFYIHSYEIVDDNKHIEVLYKKLFCEDCRYDLGTEFWTEQTVSHFFFTGDDKCKCGYRKSPECRHIRTAETFVGTSYTPSETDPGVHWAEPNYKVTCLDCGYVRNQTGAGIPEHHEFDENGRCICGYKQKPVECSHEKTDRRDIDTKYISIAGDTRNHTVEQVYETYCLACAQVLSTLQDSWAEAHQYNSDGLCTICGYQIDPDAVTEPLKVSLAVWQKTAVINTSIGVTATVSGGSGNFRYQWSAASEQGKHAQSNSAKASWAITPASADAWQFSLTIHDLTTGEQVTAYSSYVTVLSECQHTGERKDYGKNHLLVTYDFDVDKDILRHLVIYNETPLWTCADCLQEISGETQTSLNRKEFHTFDEETNKCVCGANRIDNFDGRLSYKLREMVEENWDPYGKWTHVYEHWDSVWANGALYINDRVVGLEFAQIAADAAATVWMVTDFVAEMSHNAQYKELILAEHIFGLDLNIPTYESAVEQIRAEIASESRYLEAGITTKQLGVVANIVADSIRYAESAAIEEYKAVNAEWLSHWDAVNSALDDDLLGITEWLTKKFPKAAKTLSVNNKAGDILGNGITGAKVLIDIYETSLQAHLIDTFAQTHINYMQNALDSIGYDQRPLRMSLQTLINETCAQYDNSGFVGNIYIDSPDWTGSVETYLKQYTNLAKEETINIACEQIPGVGVAGLVFLGIDLATGNATKTDDLLAYKKAYEIAEGSHESLLSAIDALHDPLTQSQLDELETKIVFYASSCQTLSNYYNGLLEYTAKKGLPISTSNYSSEDFIAETSAYINLFKRIDKRQD